MYTSCRFPPVTGSALNAQTVFSGNPVSLVAGPVRIQHINRRRHQASRKMPYPLWKCWRIWVLISMNLSATTQPAVRQTCPVYEIRAAQENRRSKQPILQMVMNAPGAWNVPIDERFHAVLNLQFPASILVWHSCLPRISFLISAYPVHDSQATCSQQFPASCEFVKGIIPLSLPKNTGRGGSQLGDGPIFLASCAKSNCCRDAFRQLPYN